MIFRLHFTKIGCCCKIGVFRISKFAFYDFQQSNSYTYCLSGLTIYFLFSKCLKVEFYVDLDFGDQNPVFGSEHSGSGVKADHCRKNATTHQRYVWLATVLSVSQNELGFCILDAFTRKNESVVRFQQARFCSVWGANRRACEFRKVRDHCAFFLVTWNFARKST